MSGNEAPFNDLFREMNRKAGSNLESLPHYQARTVKPRANYEPGDGTKITYQLYGMLSTEIFQTPITPMELPHNDTGEKIQCSLMTDIWDIPETGDTRNVSALEIALQADVALTKLHVKNSGKMAFDALSQDCNCLDAWRVIASQLQFISDKATALHSLRELLPFARFQVTNFFQFRSTKVLLSS